MKAQEFTCTVQTFRMLTPTVFETTFETNNPVEFEAGQFFSIIIPGAGPGGRNLRRAYSIASPPQTRPIELCVKVVDGGPGTQYLHGLKPGTSFQAVAPYGDFVYKTAPGRNACFVATGTGIAPFRAMVLSEMFRANPAAATWALLGVREENELLYLRDFESLAGSVTWVPCVSRPTSPWKGYHGRVTGWLREQAAVFPWVLTDFYLCGGGDMIKEVKEILASHGVTKEAIHTEKYF